MNIEVQKKRFMTMAAISGACLLVAVAALIGSVALNSDALLVAFFCLMGAGFGVQIWFVLGLKRAGRAE